MFGLHENKLRRISSQIERELLRTFKGRLKFLISGRPLEVVENCGGSISTALIYPMIVEMWARDLFNKMVGLLRSACGEIIPEKRFLSVFPSVFVPLSSADLPLAMRIASHVDGARCGFFNDVRAMKNDRVVFVTAEYSKDTDTSVVSEFLAKRDKQDFTVILAVISRGKLSWPNEADGVFIVSLGATDR